MLRFLSVIHHKSPRYNHAFSKKTQHLQRWISLQPFTQGRLVPRQPWAIKGTTPTALHCHNIHNYRCTRWNIGTTLATLRNNGIHGDRYIHWNISTTPTALYYWNIRIIGYIPWNIAIKQIPLCTKNLRYAKYIHWKTIFIPTALTIGIIYIDVYHATYYLCNTYALRNNQRLIMLCFQKDGKPHK